MLDPRGRQLLISSLRPPDGFRFDCAVGTTYSLDLIALLTTPLAFAMFDWQEDDGKLAADPSKPTADPLALLESLRRCADRIHIYCQAGQIKVPPTNQRLLMYLEQSVIEVQAPAAKLGRKAVFHPKVWAIRYINSAQEVRYRLLCLSRNLTFDRSWDTVLVLEGELTDRQLGYGENRLLANFFRDLPSLALREQGVSHRAEVDTARIADELRVVKWEHPEGVETLEFLPIGMDGKGKWPFPEKPEKIDRLLVLAPFVTDEFLNRISSNKTDQYLVSRDDSLQALQPQTLTEQWSCFTLEDGLTAGDSEADTESVAQEMLSGLHAKVFIADMGWDAHVWTGSANATTAAFGGNVEFLVKMVGKKSKLGVEATIGEGSDTPNLRSMLVEFVPSVESTALDADLLAAEKLIDEVRLAITSLPLVVRVSLAAESDGGSILTTVESTTPLPVWEGITVRCRPVLFPAPDAKTIEPGQPVSACFGPHAPESVSAFVVFVIVAEVNNSERSAQFVVNLPLVGAPSDRKEHLLRDLLKDSRTLLRFLMLLLSDDPEQLFEELCHLGQGQAADSARASDDLLPLLEHLLRTLHRTPEKLEQVHTIIEDLKKTAEGRSILLLELESIWEPINRARQPSTAKVRRRGAK